MRIVIGYDQGRPLYRDEGPGYGGSTKLGGQLVIGGPGPNDRAHINEISRQHVERTKAAREAERAHCALTGRCRHHICTRARASEALRLWEQGDASLEEIGRALGGRHYSTVIYLRDLASRARATWDNDSAGTSSTSVDSLIDAVPLLVPGGAASSRHGQGLDA